MNIPHLFSNYYLSYALKVKEEFINYKYYSLWKSFSKAISSHLSLTT